MSQILDRYIFAQFWIALGFACFALIGMFWLAQVVPLINNVVLFGESAMTFFSLSMLLIPRIAQLVLPLVGLIATLFVLNKMSIADELLILSASGRNPMRLFRPIFLGGLVIMGLLFFLSLYLTPLTQYQLRLNLATIKDNFANNVIQSGKFQSPIDGLVIYAEESIKSGEMLDIFIHDSRDPERFRTYFADRGVLSRGASGLHLGLINGEMREHSQLDGRVAIGKFGRFDLNLDIGEPKDHTKYANGLEVPMGYLLERAIRKDGSLSPGWFAVLLERVTYPLLGILMPLVALAGFLRAPYSRYGYKIIIFWIVVFGLHFQAVANATRPLVEADLRLSLVSIWPLFATILMLIWCWNGLRGRQAQ